MKKHALNIAAFVWGVAEGTLFFIVPDVILTYIALRHGARAGFVASLCAAIGAAVGGSVMFLWSAHDAVAAHAAVSAVPAINEHMIGAAQVAMTEHWFYATVLGPLSSTPYKVFAILAPQVGAPLWAFAIGSVFARLPRFLLVSAGTALIAKGLRKRLSERALLITLIVAWVVFYAVFFRIIPSGDEVVFD